MSFEPLSVREGRVAAEKYTGPHDGVPDWIAVHLWEWLELAIEPSEGPMGHDQLFIDRLRTMSLELRFPIRGVKNGAKPAVAMEWLRTSLPSEPSRFLDVVDYVLQHFAVKELAAVLEQLLSTAGSTYRVATVERGFRLEKRIDPVVTAALERVATPASRAGSHLAKAWGYVYGRNPDPSPAYREAVKAVESAGKPLIQPNNERATLGTMLGVLDVERANLRIALNPEAPGDAFATLKANMQLLWKAQLDRHGTDDVDAPLAVTRAEAEMALHLAAMLVHWFTSGLVTRA